MTCMLKPLQSPVVHLTSPNDVVGENASLLVHHHHLWYTMDRHGIYICPPKNRFGTRIMLDSPSIFSADCTLTSAIPTARITLKGSLTWPLDEVQATRNKGLVH